MTHSKHYKFGPYMLKCYFKPVGNGFEVGMTHAGRTYFVGNFVHQAEAKKWWGMMNSSITTFGKKYWMSNETPFPWYCHFLTTHMYKAYYSYLDKLFSKYNKTYDKAFSQNLRRFKTQYLPHSEQTYYPVRKAA